MTGPKGTEQETPAEIAQCCLCGRLNEIYDLPGRGEKYCLACSADFASVAQLATEIDAATIAGQDAAPLIAEYRDLTFRLLNRAQTSEHGAH